MLSCRRYRPRLASPRQSIDSALSGVPEVARRLGPAPGDVTRLTQSAWLLGCFPQAIFVLSNFFTFTVPGRCFSIGLTPGRRWLP
jgi:hypothetical protein